MKAMKKPMDNKVKSLQSYMLNGLSELFDLDYKKLHIDYFVLKMTLDKNHS